jgi:hypothetical protein
MEPTLKVLHGSTAMCFSISHIVELDSSARSPLLKNVRVGFIFQPPYLRTSSTRAQGDRLKLSPGSLRRSSQGLLQHRML